MSHNETAAPTPRMWITPTTTPEPPWSGKKFTCGACHGEFQLEAADQCELRIVINDSLRAYNTPPCPTPGCGHVNIIELRVDKPGYREQWENPDQPGIEGNAS